jgi:outer membrane protein TolC
MRRLNRWRWLGACLMALAGLTGCTQHHFMTEADFKHVNNLALCGTTGTNCPDAADLSVVPKTGDIRTVLSPEATKTREIRLAECLALALEKGRSGENFRNFSQGSGLPLQPGPQNGQSGSSDAIRVFAFDPAIRGIDIEQALAKFDAYLRTGVTWNKVDRPVGTALDSFQGAFAQINAIAQDTASFQSSLVKPLATGGLAGITFNTDYEYSNLNARVNPAYRPVASLTVEQPLLRGFGVGINELLDAHPGSIRTQVPTGGRVPGILLSRLNTEQSKIDFERRVSNLCFAVEEAYWRLDEAFWIKYSREIALRQALESWNIANAKYKAGSSTLLDLKTVETQYRNFQNQYVQALGGVLEAERRLRYMVGLPPEDGERLIPADTPNEAPFRPDYTAAVTEALNERPDLKQARLEIQRSHFEILRTENNLLPDVRAFANYDFQGLGGKLDGDGPNNAFTPILNNQYQNWSVGVLATMQLGFRNEHSEVQRAKFQLMQRSLSLQENETRITYEITQIIRQLIENHRAIEIIRGQREAASEVVKLRYQAYKAGKETINFLLEAQRDLADALRQEHSAITNYNIALANFEAIKGTIMNHNNVKIMDGPLPECVETRASEHLRQRMGAIIIRESGTGPLFEKTGGMIGADLPKAPVSIKEMHDAAKDLPALPDKPEEVKPAKAETVETPVKPVSVNDMSLLPPGMK